MKTHRRRTLRLLSLVIVVVSLTFVSTRLKADTGTCGGEMITLPFTDVAASNIFFCSIAEAFFSGLTNGTTGTTYSPSDPVSREQMAAFVSRTLDQSVKRSNLRAALGQWWTDRDTVYRPHIPTLDHNPRFLACDGLTVWVSNTDSNTVSRLDIRTHTMILRLGDIPSPEQIVVVGAKVFVASSQSPGKIFYTYTSVMPGDDFQSFYFPVGDHPVGMTYDGINLWTANDGAGPGTGSISRVRLASSTVTTTFTTGFSQPRGILFDGANLWVTDAGDASLKRVNTITGAVVQTIALNGSVQHPVFDGTNLWIPCAATPAGVPNQVFVVRGVGGLVGTVLATLTGNGLNGAFQAAFDGERICVTNANTGSVSLWKATDLSPITSVNLEFPDVPAPTRGICSNGTFFFIGLRSSTPSGTDYVIQF